MKSTNLTLSIIDPEYRRFIDDLKARVTAARVSAARHVNRDLILLYWDIGQAIHEKQKTHNWGDAVVEMVARDLKAAFPGSTGFSPPNVWRMRQFYRDHTDAQFLTQVVRELSRKGKQVPEGENLSQLVRDIVTRKTALGQATPRSRPQCVAGRENRNRFHRLIQPCKRIWL